MNTLEKQCIENLRKAFVNYQNSKRSYSDDNLNHLIAISRKIGCKQIIRYAAMDEKILSLETHPFAKEAHDRLILFIRNYYETYLLFSILYGSIKLIANPIENGLTLENAKKLVEESILSCCNFYIEYDGLKDPDVMSIISTIQEKGVIAILNALRFNYTSSGFFEFKELFNILEKKYLPIIGIMDALSKFLLDYPIDEIA